MRSLVGVTLLVGVPLLGLLPLFFLNPKACALLCNVFVQSRQFHAKFVCLFFHVKFSTILASIVFYDSMTLQLLPLYFARGANLANVIMNNIKEH